MTSSQSETRSPSLRSVTFAETVILDQTEILAHTDPSVPTLCQWSVMSENAQSGSSVVVSEWGDCKLSISTKNGFTSEDQIRIRLNLCPSERVVSSHCTQIIPTEWERVARVMKR